MVMSSQRDLLESFNFCLWLSCVVLAVMGLRQRPLAALGVNGEPEPVAVMDLTLDGLDPAEVGAASAVVESSQPADAVPAEPLSQSEPLPAPALAQELQTPLPELPEMPVAKPEKNPVSVAVKATDSSAVVTDAVAEARPAAVAPAASAKNVNTARESSAARRSSGSAAAAAGRSRGVATTLTLGQGQGRQPAPIYPLKARRAFQQGTVTVEFVVAENGEVSSAWIERPCQWPILNEVAVETIRRRWHFDPGTTRHFRIPIVFTLE